MKVLYRLMQGGYRGTEVATYNLANAAEVFADIEPIICVTTKRPAPALEKFQQRFKVIQYDEDWIEGNNGPMRARLEQIVEEEEIDWHYVQLNGFVDDSAPRNCKNFYHYVFTGGNPNGNRYVAISQYLAKKYVRQDYLNYIVSPVPIKAPPYMCRDSFGLPRDALVLGWTGGETSFSIPWVTAALPDLLASRKDLWLIFLGLQLPFKHERIIELPPTTDEHRKWAMISTCDAMLHSRRDGETFGMACGEFSRAGKRVITWDGFTSEYDRAHIDLLGDKAALYKNSNDLKKIIMNLEYTDSFLERDRWRAYEGCGAVEVARKFGEYLT